MEEEERFDNMNAIQDFTEIFNSSAEFGNT